MAYFIQKQQDATSCLVCDIRTGAVSTMNFDEIQELSNKTIIYGYSDGTVECCYGSRQELWETQVTLLGMLCSDLTKHIKVTETNCILERFTADWIASNDGVAVIPPFVTVASTGCLLRKSEYSGPLSYVRGLEIPDSVHTLQTAPHGHASFSVPYIQYDIQELCIPDTVTTIGRAAFIGDAIAEKRGTPPNRIGVLRLPQSLEVLEDLTFAYFGSIQEIHWGGSLKRIKKNAFMRSTLPKELVLPSTLESVGSESFKQTNFEVLRCNEGLNFIGDSAFKESSVKEVYFASTLEELYESAFGDCKSLEVVHAYFSETCDEYAYLLNAENAFSGCESLRVFEGFEHFVHIDAECFKGCSKLSGLKFSDQLQFIGHDAFEGTGLQEVVLHFDEQDKYKVSGFDTGAFTNCKNLCSVTIKGYVPQLPSSVFANCDALKHADLRSVTGLTTLGIMAFSSCASLKEVLLPDGLQGIGNSAFAYCHLLKSIKLPDTIKRIGHHAFTEVGIIEMRLPASVEFVDAGAFAKSDIKRFGLHKGNSAEMIRYCQRTGREYFFIDEDSKK